MHIYCESKQLLLLVPFCGSAARPWSVPQMAIPTGVGGPGLDSGVRKRSAFDIHEVLGQKLHLHSIVRNDGCVWLSMYETPPTLWKNNFTEFGKSLKSTPGAGHVPFPVFVAVVI